RSPGFAATAVLTLALGIGATTAIFTLVYQVILRSLPVAHPEQLYKVGKGVECCVTSGLQDHWQLFSYDLYSGIRKQLPAAASVAAVQAGQTTLSARRQGDSGVAQPLVVRFVSGNYFSVLGVQPYAGRLLRDDDDREGAAPGVVLSYTLWKTKFAGDPGLVGRTLLLSGNPVTVIGIAAVGFVGERNQQDPPGVWLPLVQEPTLEPERRLSKFPNMHWLDLLVRVKDRAQVVPVQLAVQAELQQWIAAHPGFRSGYSSAQVARQTTELTGASGGINELRDQYEKSLRLLLLVSGFVLLIACANLANLMLVRGMGRQQEIAVRSALGAPRGRLVRQMLVESLLLAGMGGAAAVLFAYAGTRGILALALRGVEQSPLSAAPSLPVLGFAFAVSLATGMLFGMAPAWISSRATPATTLRGAGRSGGDRSALPQRLLVVLQASLSLVLLATAGLLLTSLRALEHQNFHFEPEGRLLVFMDMQAAGYKYDRLAPLYRRFDETFARLPNVISFAYGTYGPMAYNNWSGGLYFPGGSTTPSDTQASYSLVSAHFFEAVGTHVLLGRGFSDLDTLTSPHVAVINQALAEKHFKGRNPLGQRFGPEPKRKGEFEIVGVVEDTKYGDPTEPASEMYFTPITQSTSWVKPEDITEENFKHFADNLIVHYRGDQAAAAASVREAFKQIDPNIPILRMLTYQEQLGANFTQEELVVRLTTLFGLLALVLASVGLYGVTAYTVARRTSEIGIRMALGASRGGVLGMIVRGALTQAAIGLAVGLPLTLAAGRLLQHTLYQTGAFQPIVLLTVVLLLLASALVAAAIPARRAAGIDPMQALRAE
ncbi:MAG TPA: ABC transporter permease, partial [Acidobacteriaceae bacterium]